MTVAVVGSISSMKTPELKTGKSLKEELHKRGRENIYPCLPIYLFFSESKEIRDGTKEPKHTQQRLLLQYNQSCYQIVVIFL